MESVKAKEICPTTTQGLIKKGALLVDVREWNEVNQVAFDVPEIMVIPLSEFEDRYLEIPKDRDVVLVCQVGVRSLKATYYLMNHGYDRVMNMEHGMDRWLQKGFPTKGNASITIDSNSGSCCGTSPTEKVETSCCGTTAANIDSSCCSAPSKDGTACC
jgi:rhodanese-related sulfurtransferase